MYSAIHLQLCRLNDGACRLVRRKSCFDRSMRSLLKTLALTLQVSLVYQRKTTQEAQDGNNWLHVYYCMAWIVNISSGNFEQRYVCAKASTGCKLDQLAGVCKGFLQIVLKRLRGFSLSLREDLSLGL